jgi:hypothetical protein
MAPRVVHAKTRLIKNNANKIRRRRSLVQPKMRDGATPVVEEGSGGMAIDSLSQIEEAGRLRFMPGRAENGTVRTAWRWTGLATAILCVCLAAVAQNQDRDTRGVPATSATAPPPEMRIDINHSSVAELLKVPGMTRSWAGRVVRFRPYRTKADLLENGVVPSEVYDRIKDYLIAHRDAQ